MDTYHPRGEDGGVRPPEAVRPEVVEAREQIASWSGYLQEVDALAGAVDLNVAENAQLYHETRAGILKVIDKLLDGVAEAS